MQQPSVESLVSKPMAQQSFGFDHITSLKCTRCNELRRDNYECEVQMKEGRAKLEENAIIV